MWLEYDIVEEIPAYLRDIALDHHDKADIKYSKSCECFGFPVDNYNYI